MTHLGAIKQWAQLQEENDAFYCVVDLHALTVETDPKLLQKRTLLSAAQLIAIGLDPNKCTLFIQSHVPAHNQLAWVLECMTGFGEAGRMTQFKDKSQKGNIPQAQIIKALAKINDLQDPNSKMSKSAASMSGVIELLDSSDVILKKFKSSVTDAGKEIKYDEKSKPGISNLLTIHSAFSGKSITEVENEFADKGYGDFKTAVADVVNSELAPIREKTATLMQDPAELMRILKIGGEKANQVASETLKKVYEAIGLAI